MLYLVYLLYTTVTYCLHYCCCCSPPREQKQRQQLLQQLISACPGVRATLIIRSTLQHTRHYSCIIPPSSVFTPARPDSSQNPQRRRRTASLRANLLLGPSACGPRNPHRTLITLHPGALLPRQPASELSQNLCCPLAPFRSPPNTPEHKGKARVP